MTILLFVAHRHRRRREVHDRAAASAGGARSVAGCAIALIFFLRMRIEDRLGKAGNVQASLGGFETEDVLYLLPLVTLCDARRTRR